MEAILWVHTHVGIVPGTELIVVHNFSTLVLSSESPDSAKSRYNRLIATANLFSYDRPASNLRQVGAA